MSGLLPFSNNYPIIALCALCILFTSFAITAESVEANTIEGKCGYDVYYSFDSENQKMTISGNGLMYDYGEYCPAPWFDDLNEHRLRIKTIEIKEGVYSIGDWTLTLTSYSTLIIPSTLHITSNQAFIYASISEIIVSEDNQLFSYVDGFLCSENLTKVVFCTNMQYDFSLMPASITKIGPCAFMQSQIRGELTIPEGITDIGNDAFRSCNFVKGAVSIPSTLRNVGERAFESTDVTSFSVSNDNQFLSSDNGFLYSKDRTTLICALNKMEGQFVIDDSVKIISDYAAYCCFDVSGSWLLPSSLVSIGDHAFDNCSGLTGYLNIPEGVVSIGDYAFFGCYNISNTITIPSSVLTIGEGVFGCCTGTQIVVSEYNMNYKSIDGILYNKNETIALACLTDKTGPLTIPDSVERIGNCAFYACNKLTGSLILPSKLTSIGRYAFCATELNGPLTLPSNVKTIENGAFTGCSFESISLNEGLKTIGAEAFSFPYKELRGTVVIPSTVNIIERHAFENCSISTLIIKTDSVSIGPKAFKGCISLLSITIEKGTDDIVPDAFVNHVFYDSNGQIISITDPNFTGHRYIGEYTSKMIQNDQMDADFNTLLIVACGLIIVLLLAISIIAVRRKKSIQIK